MQRAALLGLLLASSAFLACGAATPAAKDADDTAAKPASEVGETTKTPAAAAEAMPTSAAPASDPPAAAPAPSPAKDSGDIKVPSDDPWLVGHQMPSKDVMGTMRTANAKVQACFQEGLKRDPSTTGEVKIRFVISHEGAVRVWKDDASSMSDGDVTQCIGEALNKQKFPKQKSPGDAWGTYSIHFGN